MNELNFLKGLGFTDYESRVFSAIFKKGIATAKEVTQASKVPKNKTYETIRRLLSKNFIIELPITPKQYKTNNIEKVKELIERKKEDIRKLENEFEDFKKLENNSEFKEFFWVVKGQKSIQEKLNYLDRDAKGEILTINKISKFLPKNIRSIKNKIKEGVKVKMICQVDESNHEFIRYWSKTGAKIKIYNKEVYGETMPKFTVYDKKLRITIGKPEIQDSEDYISLIIESPSLINIFRNQFNMMWKNSLDLNPELDKYNNK